MRSILHCTMHQCTCEHNVWDSRRTEKAPAVIPESRKLQPSCCGYGLEDFLHHIPSTSIRETQSMPSPALMYAN